MLKVGEPGNLGHQRHRIVPGGSQGILHLPIKAGNHLIPFTDFFDQRLNIPPLPVIAFILHRSEDAQFLGVIEQLDQADMTAEEVPDAAAIGVAGVSAGNQTLTLQAGSGRQIHILSATTRNSTQVQQRPGCALLHLSVSLVRSASQPVGPAVGIDGRTPLQVICER